jgi:hypothetical protein
MSSTIGKIAPNQVQTDLNVQRVLDQRRVQAIAGNLKLDAIGVPTISRRPDGGHVVLDGQHRLEALKVAGYGDRLFEMTMYTDLSVEEEAELFRLLNNTKKLSALEMFRISLVERNPESMSINDIVMRNGYVTTAGSANSCIAVKTLRAIYRRDLGDTLHRTLTVCRLTWGDRKHATHQTLLSSLAVMLFRYGHTVNLDRLSGKLRTNRDGSNPSTFIGTISSLASVNGCSVADAGGGKLVTIYNSHYEESSTNRLADWR